LNWPCTFDMLSSGEHGLLYSDLQALEAKEVHAVPLTYLELEKILGMLRNLIAVVLGDVHPLVVAYQDFWNLLVRVFQNELQLTIDTIGHIKLAHLL
jgi:hypothetical protein